MLDGSVIMRISKALLFICCLIAIKRELYSSLVKIIFGVYLNFMKLSIKNNLYYKISNNVKNTFIVLFYFFDFHRYGSINVITANIKKNTAIGLVKNLNQFPSKITNDCLKVLSTNSSKIIPIIISDRIKNRFSGSNVKNLLFKYFSFH